MVRRPPDRDPDDAPAPVVHRGRGAVTNPDGRFETHTRASFDDGWSAAPCGGDDGDLDVDDERPGPDTVVTDEAIRSIIARNDSPDVPFDQSINPYRGCEHGCIYCFARPTHAYLGMSPGLDFETRIRAKPDAAAVLRAELARPGYRCSPINLGANTDPYQPVERERRITRAVLEVLADADHPVTVVTKSALVVRDLDLLAPMAARGLTSVCVSITTLDPHLAAVMEPRAARPSRRLAAVRALAEAGVPVGVLASPMIPAINDGELERVLEAAAAAGASFASWILIRLPLEVRRLFDAWLRSHFPDRAERVLSLIRDTRDGALYDPRPGLRMRGTGAYAQLIERRYSVAARRLGLDGGSPALDTSQFRPPAPGRQLRLL